MLTAGVLHDQSVDGSHVHLHTWQYAEFELLQQNGQEEKDLEAGNSLANAPPLAQAKEKHLLTQCLVNSATGSEKPFWPELRRVTP